MNTVNDGCLVNGFKTEHSIKETIEYLENENRRLIDKFNQYLLNFKQLGIEANQPLTITKIGRWDFVELYNNIRQVQVLIGSLKQIDQSSTVLELNPTQQSGLDAIGSFGDQRRWCLEVTGAANIKSNGKGRKDVVSLFTNEDLPGNTVRYFACFKTAREGDYTPMGFQLRNLENDINNFVSVFEVTRNS